jgi:pyruvate,water dikinase
VEYDPQNPNQQSGFQISFLHQLPSNQPSIYGGKATNLARLHQNGIPVPRGFVIPIQGFNAFISECKRNESYTKLQLDQDDFEELVKSSEAFRRIASEYVIPISVEREIIRGFNHLRTNFKVGSTGYAIRSSATAEDTEQFSFAGQADSFLCVSDLPTIIEAVKKTWLSLYSPKALLYLQAKGIKIDQIQMAVIVQEMILGEISGVMFTANVANNDYQQLLIDSTWGLGESIVSGKVIPDSFILQKSPLKILKRHLGEKAFLCAPHPNNHLHCTMIIETPKKQRDVFSLKDAEIISLARIGMQIEEQMGHPQDIEWTLKEGQFVILQTRPITTL